MDFTPKAEDSGHISSSFDAPSSVFESTPKSETEVTPQLSNSNLKKRKIQFCDIKGRKLNDLLEICPSTPQASSTLNESLTTEFENIKIEQNYFTIDDCDGPAPKFLKTNGCEKLVTPPSTPESHLKTFECTPRKTGSFQKCSSSRSVPTPLKEQHEILYPTLKPLEPQKKPLTPQEFKRKLEIGHNSTPYNKFLHVTGEVSKEKRLLTMILTNDIVMSKIFNYLSNGDLFRVSMVSSDFRGALFRNTKASQRFSIYRECHKKNKENYKITPPSSPENQSVFAEGSVSPRSQNFVEFVEAGSFLNPNQSLIKCPKCNRPSVVEKSIAQCQEVISCGYIFCQKCDSFSYNPDEFIDKCQGLKLGSSLTRKRSRLEDLTNCSPDFNVSSVFNSTAEHHYYSSGYYSGYETSHTPLSVKRNLSASFSGNDSLLKPQKALFDSNRSLNASAKLYKREEKRRSSGNVVPIVPSGTLKKMIEVIEPSSPPKVKSYSACSKESRRNLKRLTR